MTLYMYTLLLLLHTCTCMYMHVTCTCTCTCREDGVYVLDELKEVEEDEQHEGPNHGEQDGMVTGQLMNT